MSTYYPYLRAKQFELSVLQELAPKMGLRGNICPILEPINDNVFLRNALVALISADVRFVFITNPLVGELANRRVDLYESILGPEMFKYENYSPALIVSENTSAEEVRRFLEKYESLWLSIIYRGEPDSQEALNEILSHERIYDHIFIEGRTPRDLRSQFSKHRVVVIRDGFKREERNADYQPSDFFTDLNTLGGNPEGFGWGDFSIVGDTFSDGNGGAAHSVAIHHVNIRNDKGGSLWIDHFVEIGETPADREGKTVRAMKQLVDKMDWLHPNNTSACKEWIQLADNENPKNLGYLKKLAIKHHFEVILGT